MRFAAGQLLPDWQPEQIDADSGGGAGGIHVALDHHCPTIGLCTATI